jgi:hypothetical protein
MRIIWPIIADSLESLDETTTVASAASEAPKRSVTPKSADLSIFDTEYLRADGRASASSSAVSVALRSPLAL